MTKSKKQQPRSRDLGARTLRGIGLAILGTGAALAGVLLARRQGGNAEHAAPDLALDRDRPGAGDRAPDAFRPDPTAAVPASEREALRPATGPTPTISEPRGSMNAQTGSANG